MVHILAILAKEAIEKHVKNGKVTETAKNFPKEFLNKKAGVFVTIKKENKLRGCIGTYLPFYENIVQETINNAIAAAIEDYRFGAVQKEELPLLSYEVSVLSEPEFVKKLEELNPKKYGVIVKSKNKSGLLLPDLEGVNTVSEQISIACQKANIDISQEKISIYRFTIKKYE